VRLLSILSSLALAAYLVWETARSPAMYRRLKEAIQSGNTQARIGFYCSVYWFEGISALLAAAALRFDRQRLDPSRLELASSSFGMWWHSALVHLNKEILIGMGIGIGISVAAIVVALKLANRRAARAPKPALKQSKLFPDVSYLLPISGRERALFALVALAAGVCEEIVFRGWLLSVFHESLNLNGWTMVLSASICFGLAHYYQGVAGIVVTSVLGLVFCGLYVGSGTLLVPIIAHVLVDLRWAVFPSMPGITPQQPGATPAATS